VPASGDSVRRRQSCVLVVGNVEPEVSPWLRAGRHAITAVRDVSEASRALDETPADLVIVDRAGALDAADVCRALREDARLEEAWLLAITVQAQGRMADAVLDAGADD
jgi:DNA-binding response OmpR family regulator